MADAEGGGELLLGAEVRNRVCEPHSAKLHANLLPVKRHTFPVVIHNSGVNTFGDRLKKLRTGRKLSQEQLAKAIGIKQGSLTQLETGKSKGPASQTLTKLARLFEVDPEWLMTGRGHQHPISALSETESELILLYRSLSGEGRDYVLGRARSVHRDELERKEAPRSRSTDQTPHHPLPDNEH